MTDPINKAVLLPCPFCGTDEHLSRQRVGSRTADMPAHPYRIVCHHIDHDTVCGPVAYGEPAAIDAWNTRPQHTGETDRSGYVLVPVEPTEAMIGACRYGYPSERRATWSAMLAARPIAGETDRGGGMAATDEFRGDDAALVASIHALLALDEKGALVPHGIGGHARKLLSASANRLGAK